MKTYKIAALVGSLRKDSFNKKVAENFIRLAPDNIQMEIVEIGDLPFYNEDLDNDNPPASWTAFRNKIKNFDGVFLFTPEYNRSISGVLKNALDVGSRPYGQSVWDGKPGAVVSVSPSALSGFGANHHLRQVLVFLNVPTMPAPEAYIGDVMDLYNNGELKEDTQEFLKSFMKSYEVWVNRF